MCSTTTLSPLRIPQPKAAQIEQSPSSSNTVFFVALAVAAAVAIAIGALGMYGKFNATAFTARTFKAVFWTATSVLALQIIFHLTSTWCKRMGAEKEQAHEAIKNWVADKKRVAIQNTIQADNDFTPSSPAGSSRLGRLLESGQKGWLATPKVPQTPGGQSAFDPFTPVRPLALGSAVKVPGTLSATQNSPLKRLSSGAAATPVKATALAAALDLSQWSLELLEPTYPLEADFQKVLADFSKRPLPYQIKANGTHRQTNFAQTFLQPSLSNLHMACSMLMLTINKMAHADAEMTGNDGKRVIDDFCEWYNAIHAHVATLKENLKMAQAHFFHPLEQLIAKIEREVLEPTKKMIDAYNEFHEKALPSLMNQFESDTSTENPTVAAARKLRNGTPFQDLMQEILPQYQWHPTARPPALFIYFLKEYSAYIGAPISAGSIAFSLPPRPVSAPSPFRSPASAASPGWAHSQTAPTQRLLFASPSRSPSVPVEAIITITPHSPFRVTSAGRGAFISTSKGMGVAPFSDFMKTDDLNLNFGQIAPEWANLFQSLKEATSSSLHVKTAEGKAAVINLSTVLIDALELAETAFYDLNRELELLFPDVTEESTVVPRYAQAPTDISYTRLEKTCHALNHLHTRLQNVLMFTASAPLGLKHQIETFVSKVRERIVDPVKQMIETNNTFHETVLPSLLEAIENPSVATTNQTVQAARALRRYEPIDQILSRISNPPFLFRLFLRDYADHLLSTRAGADTPAHPRASVDEKHVATAFGTPPRGSPIPPPPAGTPSSF